MVAMSADDISKRWSSNLAASTPRIQAGVQAVSTAPGLAAARASDRYLAGVQANVPKYQTNVAAVTLAEWQDATLNKGIQRIPTGAQAAEQKFAAFMGRLIPYINSGLTTLPARGGLEQNIARSAAWIRHMSKFKNK